MTRAPTGPSSYHPHLAGFYANNVARSATVFDKVYFALYVNMEGQRRLYCYCLVIPPVKSRPSNPFQGSYIVKSL